MAAPFEELAELDRLIHEPARLAILTALSVCRDADFVYLQRITGLSKGNLSSHLSKLADASLVAIDKQLVEYLTHTRVSLTRTGRAAIERHWDRLDRLRRASLAWSPETA